MSQADFVALSPLMIVSATAVLLMLTIAIRRNHRAAAVISLIGLAAALGSLPFASSAVPRQVTAFLILDFYSFLYMAILLTAAAFVFLFGYDYLNRRQEHREEFYLLVLLATTGAMVLAASSNFASFFLGLELLSVALYALIAYIRTERVAIEAGIKYLVLAASSSSVLLFGLALIYSESGSMELSQFTAITRSTGHASSVLLLTGLMLTLTGIGFKLAVVPFHLWTPDVYEGAPTPVTALFSAGPKAAAFALLLRIFATVPAATHFWFWAFWILAALTMFAGNLGALVQTNIKRLLAYSSIAHAGYILVAFAAVTSMAKGGRAEAAVAYAAVLFYLLSYALVKLGAFTIVSQLGGAGEKNLSLDDYAGLSQRQPVVAAMLSIYLLSLLGLPVTAGFFGKFYIFKAAVNSHLLWLAVLMAINSIIGAYYYLRVIVLMYMREPSAESAAAAPVGFPLTVNVVLAVTAIGTILFGLMPNPVINFILQPTLFGH